MRRVVIVEAARTAIGKFLGSLSGLSAADLGATVIQGILTRTGLKLGQIDEVILGQVLTAGCGQNPARQAAMKAGLPEHIPAMTINKLCGSGLKSVVLGAQAIMCGNANVILAGGQENMSISPLLLSGARHGIKLGDAPLVDSMLKDGLTDAFHGIHMGVTAENIARHYGITRSQQDEFAAMSQQKAEVAQKSGRFSDEIIPVSLPQRHGDPVLFNNDEFPRHGTTAASLSKLNPAFDKQGSVTPGNASGINDGAAVVLLMAEEYALEHGFQPMATLTAYASAGVDPKMMGMGPVPASRLCLERAGWGVDHLDLIELNEAFAAQACAVNNEMGWDVNKINVNGGAIALGHPIGASGCRVLVTLLHEMRRRSVQRGLAALCIGGGMGIAVAVTR